MIPFDLAAIIDYSMEQESKMDDGMLHPSTHLATPLRHAQLEYHHGSTGYKRTTAENVRLMTGTMWHEYMHNALRRAGVPVMCEVNLTPYLPGKWSGTADWFFWSKEHKGFILSDLKTIRGAGIKWREQYGPYESNTTQLGAYWLGGYNMGIPIVSGAGIFYLPMDSDDDASPLYLEFDVPLIGDIHTNLERREYAILEMPLADPPAREQKLFKNKNMRRYDVKLVPPKEAMWCRWPDLCSCKSLKTEIVGYYDRLGRYKSRKGREDIEPTVKPMKQQLEKL